MSIYGAKEMPARYCSMSKIGYFIEFGRRVGTSSGIPGCHSSIFCSAVSSASWLPLQQKGKHLAKPVTL